MDEHFGNGLEKRLNRASQVASDYWLPINPDVLKKIQSGLSAGSYSDDVDSLVSDLKGDFSLFFAALRRLVRLLQSETAPIISSNPLGLIRNSQPEHLQRIFEGSSYDYSPHRLERASQLQTGRLNEAFTSAAAVEALAEESSLGGELGFSSALIRQLGYTLIAWNFPKFYCEALAQVDEKVSLDVALTKRCGFSPLLLAAKVLHDWGIPQSLYSVLTVGAPLKQVSEELSQRGKSLACLCDVGEALGRARQPDIYPTARRDWKYAETAIRLRLGPAGMAQIQRSLTVCLIGYSRVFESPPRHAAEHAPDTGNPYLPQCGAELQQGLLQLYSGIAEKQSAENSIRVFFSDILRLSQFHGGAVFTFDPGTQLLIVQTVIEHLHTRDPAEPVPFALNRDHPIVRAFRGEIITEQGQYREPACTALHGPIGNTPRVGTLCLELEQSSYFAQPGQILIEFRALLRALEACLKLHSD